MRACRALTERADYFADACYQALVYWIMSALTNDPFTLARFAGLYKAVQSAGAAGSYGMDAVSTPWMNELVSLLPVVRTQALTSAPQLASWLMMVFSFPLAFLVLRTVKETNYDQEEVVYVDDVKQGAMEEGAPDADSSIEKEAIAAEDIKS